MADKKLEIVFDDREPKKHSVRFNCKKENTPVSSVYITNAGISVLGDPSKIKVTIEAAE